MKRSKNPIICRCEEIRERDVIEAVRTGATDVDAVKRMLRAGMGLCQGKTCGYLIPRIIARETGKAYSKILPVTSRPPVRPIPVKVLGGEERGKK